MLTIPLAPLPITVSIKTDFQGSLGIVGSFKISSRVNSGLPIKSGITMDCFLAIFLLCLFKKLKKEKKNEINSNVPIFSCCY